MKLRVVWLGRTRNRGLAEVTGDLRDRASRLVPLEIVELKEPRIADERRRIEAEGERLVAAVGPSDYLVALDDTGKTFTSPALAEFIEKRMLDGARDLVFAVGGHAGLSPSVKKRADLIWSLSKLTLSHDLARTVLVEQIYRALTIIRNLPYAR